MRDYGRVYSRFWQSKSIRYLDQNSKLLALYLLTSPHANLIGCYYLPFEYALADTKYPSETLREGFQALEKSGFCEVDWDNEWIWVKNYVRWNPFENPNVKKSAAKVVRQVPKSLCFFNDFIDTIAEDGEFTEETKRELAQLKPNPSETLPEQTPLHSTPVDISVPDGTRANSDPDKPPDDPPASPSQRDLCRQAMAIWQDELPGLPKPERLTEQRIKKFSARMRNDLGGDIHNWRALCQQIRGSPFLMGEKGDFCAKFDWVLEPRNMVKILEGNYDQSAGGSVGRQTQLHGFCRHLAESAEPELAAWGTTSEDDDAEPHRARIGQS